VLNKENNYGGITIENEKEILLIEPPTSEKETQTELSSNDIEKLNKKIEEQGKRIKELEITNNELKKQVSQLKEDSSKKESKQEIPKKEHRGTCSKC
jgi:predicted RNase H-like nuclease (RuvC/YqgF family)